MWKVLPKQYLGVSMKKICLQIKIGKLWPIFKFLVTWQRQQGDDNGIPRQ